MTKKLLPDVFCYRYVWADAKMVFEVDGKKRTFRILLYGARMNKGLLMPTCNGVAVLDEDFKSVVCDDIYIDANMGEDYAPTKFQKDGLQAILSWGWEEFVRNINMHPRSRGPILEVI